METASWIYRNKSEESIEYIWGGIFWAVNWEFLDNAKEYSEASIASERKFIE